jgi:hypothetical protein
MRSLKTDKMFLYLKFLQLDEVFNSISVAQIWQSNAGSVLPGYFLESNIQMIKHFCNHCGLQSSVTEPAIKMAQRVSVNITVFSVTYFTEIVMTFVTSRTFRSKQQREQMS